MTKKEKEKILKKIKVAMAESGISQTQLAQKLGITQAAVSAWFKGKGTPNIDTISRVADTLKKPINYFFDNSTDVRGNGNVVGKNINVAIDEALRKDVALLTAKVAALESKLEMLSMKYDLLKKNHK
ncbi:MAG: helix-turn-helix transcriptional regulator [Elusimicrobiaceae bacterium]|nr:helix-turn-helix transcriptional regulator [Elusimicrobiaceae bacterium]